MVDERAPATIWLTGLSGAGKTTIGRALVVELQARGRPAVLLDGDEIRAGLSDDLGFSRADRDRQVARVGWLCGLLNRHGIVAVAALVSPYRAAREEVRAAVAPSRFVEVHVSAPLDVLAARDPKGHYRRQRAGQLAGLSGIDDPYEPPPDPDVVCHTGGEPVAACVTRILEAIGAA